jgi:hypothetical protein
MKINNTKKLEICKRNRENILTKQSSALYRYLDQQQLDPHKGNGFSFSLVHESDQLFHNVLATLQSYLFKYES